MSYIVLENIPNTPEGRAFLKQLRKYLQPQYKMRSRGRHSDRKGLAERLIKEGAVKWQRRDVPGLTEDQAIHSQHFALRAGMSCKYAERITTVIDANNERGIAWHRKTAEYRAGYYLYAGTPKQQGPFKTWDAARMAKRITEGVKS